MIVLVVAFLVAGTPLPASELLFYENFESYEPGLLEPGATGSINDAWHTFRADIRKSHRFLPEVRLMDGAGTDRSRGLRLSAGLRKLTTSSFFLGVRHVFTADLGDADLSRLSFTAQVRAEVTDTRTGRSKILPEEFFFGWRLESVGRKRGRGVRQFDATAMGAFQSIGGLLSEAISGRRLDYGELNLAEGPAEYQIVLVLSSCCIGPIYRSGSWDIEIFLDDIRLELLDPVDDMKAPQVLDSRFSTDDCATGRHFNHSLTGSRPLE